MWLLSSVIIKSSNWKPPWTGFNVSFSGQKVPYLCIQQTSKIIICGPKIGMFFIYVNQSVQKLLMVVKKFKQLTYSSMKNIFGPNLSTFILRVTPIYMMLIWIQKTILITKNFQNISKASVINSQVWTIGFKTSSKMTQYFLQLIRWFGF